MKTKVLLAIVALSYAPLMVAGNEAPYPKEKIASFVVEKMDLTSLPSVQAEEGKRKEDTCGLRFHGAEDGRKRSHHRGAGQSEEVGDQGSRPEIFGNLRLRCGTRRKRGRDKDAKCRTAEKEEFECIAKGARVVSRICCVSGDWR